MKVLEVGEMVEIVEKAKLQLETLYNTSDSESYRAELEALINDMNDVIFTMDQVI